ncbi:MAG TPA: DUF1003 domain-containing protein [Bacillota bacterium]|nr:DUF1003 domain-containing protein [Bacillota bacterium]HNT03312.1 DUF1003 domain-containing protein [Bacillota bacterium]HOH89323.1 DUF1003 domain-containing protein [Bacillota bacterium]HQA66596.1 DUF1003 domain-containing protein [Bacillota bacterium]HQO41838.1 DUF1003 domain-containing protein [Bacillota bacterium]
MDKNDLKDIIISDEEEREEQIHELIRGKRSLDINKELSKTLTFGERMADKIARFAGSWSFLGFFAIVVLAWAFINSKIVLDKPFDRYPYVFLNLVLGCIASIQAPIIMMSQNREAQKDRLHSENEYLINLKSEIILEDLHMKTDQIIREQRLLKKELENIKMEMEKTSSNIQLGRKVDGKNDTGGKEPELYS